MAKSGRATKVGSDAGALATRQKLVDAAIESLREDGFVGASARRIAGRAGCNQGLVFYHFGTVANLLLAGLDQTSSTRMAYYQRAVASASSPSEMMAAATAIYREDLDAGHLTVLAELIAGASSTPGLGAEVAARIEPWIDFAESAIDRMLSGTPLAGIVASRDAAYAVVGLYLGVEMLSHLDGARRPAESLLASATRAAGLFEMLSAGVAGVHPPTPTNDGLPKRRRRAPGNGSPA